MDQTTPGAQPASPTPLASTATVAEWMVQFHNAVVDRSRRLRRMIVDADDVPPWDLVIRIGGVDFVTRGPMDADEVHLAEVQPRPDRWPGILAVVVRFFVGAPAALDPFPASIETDRMREVVAAFLPKTAHARRALRSATGGQIAVAHAIYLTTQQVWMERITTAVAAVVRESMEARAAESASDAEPVGGNDARANLRSFLDATDRSPGKKTLTPLESFRPSDLRSGTIPFALRAVPRRRPAGDAAAQKGAAT